MPSVRRQSEQRFDGVIAYCSGVLVGSGATAAILILGAGVFTLFPWDLRGLSFLLLLSALLIGRVTGRINLPQRKWQIPIDVFRDSPVAGAFLFGVNLGLGFRTYIPSISPYILALSLLLLTNDPLIHLSVMMGFAVGRSSPMVGRLLSDHRDQWNERLMHSLPSVGVAAVITALGLAGLLMAQALG